MSTNNYPGKNASMGTSYQEENPTSSLTELKCLGNLVPPHVWAPFYHSVGSGWKKGTNRPFSHPLNIAERGKWFSLLGERIDGGQGNPVIVE